MARKSNKKILVYDVAAENGGSLVVLQDFYTDAHEYSEKNENISFVFVTGLPLLEPKDNLEVVTFPWVKKSWLHRLYFEKVYVKKLLKKIKPDVIISLQNTTVKHFKGMQYVYMHQSLQYCVKKFSFFKKSERALAIRQKLICGGYRKGLKKAKKIYVQTEWIKKATEDWLKAKEGSVEVVPVMVFNLPQEIPSYDGLKTKRFFYPARAEIYKNHALIVEACQILKERGIADYQVIFTFEGEENHYANYIKEKAQGLPISFIGALSREKVFQLYSQTILLFPSFLETCGLPLLEAKAFGGYILASKMPFCKEALKNYNNCDFFEYQDSNKLADLMEQCVLGEVSYCKQRYKEEKKNSGLLATMLLDIQKEDRNEE